MWPGWLQGSQAKEEILLMYNFVNKYLCTLICIFFSRTTDDKFINGRKYCFFLFKNLTLTTVVRKSIISWKTCIATSPTDPWLAMALAGRVVTRCIVRPHRVAGTINAAGTGMKSPMIWLKNYIDLLLRFNLHNEANSNLFINIYNTNGTYAFRILRNLKLIFFQLL